MRSPPQTVWHRIIRLSLSKIRGHCLDFEAAELLGILRSDRKTLVSTSHLKAHEITEFHAHRHPTHVKS